MNRPFFMMSNVHAMSCGDPPTFSNDIADDYYGYFENRHGEQWVFTYSRSKKKAEIRGGDPEGASRTQARARKAADLGPTHWLFGEL